MYIYVCVCMHLYMCIPCVYIYIYVCASVFTLNGNNMSCLATCTSCCHKSLIRITFRPPQSYLV